MAVALRSKHGIVTWSGGTASGTASITTGSDVQSGDLLVAVHGSDYAPVADTAMPTLAGSGWIKHHIQNGESSSTYRARSAIATKLADGGAETVTADIVDGGTVCLHVYVFTGADRSGILVNGATNTGTSCAVPSLSAPGPGVMVAGWAPRYAAATITVSGITGGSGTAIADGRYIYHTSTLQDFFLSMHEFEDGGATPTFAATSSSSIYWAGAVAYIPEAGPLGPTPPETRRTALRATAFLI
jgi:hypothetical protein